MSIRKTFRLTLPSVLPHELVIGGVDYAEIIARIDAAALSVQSGLDSMEHANALIDRHGERAAPYLEQIGFAAEAAERLTRPDDQGRLGFSVFTLERQRLHLAELAAARADIVASQPT